MVMIPDNFLYLLQPETKAFAYLATVMGDLSPQVTPVWFAFDGENFLVNTVAGRVKDRNMLARGKVSLLISDPENPYKYIHLKAVVADRFEDESLIHRLSQVYTGKPRFNIKPGDVRITYKLKPEKVFSYDW